MVFSMGRTELIGILFEVPFKLENISLQGKLIK